MATAYATLLEFEGTLPPNLLDAQRTTEADRQRELDRASADADAHLRAAGYTPPLDAATLDDELIGRVFDIAHYRLAVHAQTIGRPTEQQPEYIAYRDAIRWLEQVAAGRIQLDIEDNEGETDTDAGGAAAMAAYEVRGWGGGW